MERRHMPQINATLQSNYSLIKLKKNHKIINISLMVQWLRFPSGAMAKNLPANTGDIKDVGSIPGLGISPGGGHGNPPQYSCLENPMDRGAWWATVHGAVLSQT